MPGNVGIMIRGAYVVRPGVYPYTDVSQMVPVRPGPGGTIAILGTADGGVPGFIYDFATFTDARKVLRGGTALALISRMFRPSGDQPGASRVRWTRVGTVGQASLTASGLVFASLDYGRHTNAISVALTAGAGGAYTLTIRKRSENYTANYMVGLGLSVTSTATTPKLVFDHVAREARMYENGSIVSVLPYPTDDVTLANLIPWITGRSGWTATIAGNPSMPVSLMDNPVLASAPAIGTSATAITAGQGSVVFALYQDAMVGAALSTPGTFGALSAVTETALAGGAGTALDVVTSSDYVAPLALLEGIDVDHLMVDTANAATQSLAIQHCIALGAINRRRWRIFYGGGAPGETATQAAAKPQTMDGPAVYAWNGTFVTNAVTGLLKENLGSLGTAAQICGLAAGLTASEPLTNKTLYAEGVEFPAPQDSDINALLVAGASPIALDPVAGGTRIIQAITTFQGGPNVMMRKLQGLRIQFKLEKAFQFILSDFVGAPMDLETANRIKNRVAAYLDSEIRGSRNPQGVLTEGSKNGQTLPAWEGLSVVGDGADAWDIQVNTHPVTETAYIPVRIVMTPQTISL